MAKWNRMPSLDKKPTPINTVFSGTTLLESNRIGQAGFLVLADPLKPVTLAAGKSSATLRLAKPSVIQDISFVSDGLDGKVAVSLSPDGKAWNEVDSDVFQPADRLVKMNAGAAQGRFLKLEFDLTRGGVLRSFQVLGSDTDANYTVKQNGDNGATVNFATGIGGGRLLYLSPESFGARGEAVRLGRLEFPESDEKYRTAVYDFGQVRTLNEFGSVHSPRPVRVTVYAFDELPEKEDWRGRLAFDPSVFDTAEPVASVEDAQGSGTVTVKPKQAVKARYVAMRWEPDFNPPSFEVGGTTMNGPGLVAYNNGNLSVTTNGNGQGGTTSNVNNGGEQGNISVDGSGNVQNQGATGSTGGNGGTGGDANNGGGNADGGGTSEGGGTGAGNSVAPGAQSALGAGIAGPGNNPSNENPPTSPSPP
jgi:hypothetical protein